MKKISLGDYILLFLVKALSLFFRMLPVGLTLFIARQFGVLAMFFNPKRRRIAYANLKSAFGGKYTPEEFNRILRRTYANIAQGLAEVLLLPKIDEDYISRYVKFENFHFAEDALKAGKGLIFLTAHFGNWEMSNAALPIRGLAYRAIARDQKPYILNRELNRYRESKGCKIISKGPGIKEILRSLRSNGIVGMLVDQDAGKDGLFVRFFNREASWHRGVMEFALKTGACVIPGFAIRQKGPRIRFKLFKPLSLPQSGSREDIIREGFRQYVRDLEEVIRLYPEQWLWQHRRWKSTPQKKVLILNDGRTGHLRQSQAIARRLRGIRVERGYKGDDTGIETIEVKFKRPYLKHLLNLRSNIFHLSPIGCPDILRFCLRRESYKKLTASYGDIIISCGSSTAGANLILSTLNNAKSLVIMKPQFVGLGKFDLAIIPRHDGPPTGLKNIAATYGALNLIDRKTVRRRAAELRLKTGPLRKRVIGALIGGPAKDFDMRAGLIEGLLDALIKASENYDCDILLTTSRRTPQSIEKIIRKRLHNHPRCRLLVIAGEGNITGAVEGILGLSRLILVSQESVSMISEAASSDAYTLVFKDKRADRRHEAFLRNLNRNNFIDITGIRGLYQGISRVFNGNIQQRTLNDLERIEEALEVLL